MDLVAGVRKEGSRGGRDAFKWEDVKESAHRENYLGHSIMAPVGRWQKGRDLHWYAKAKEEDQKAEDQAKREREEEIRRIKEAEQEAMARALGLPVAPKSTNANLTPLGGKEVQKAVQETTAQDDDEERGRGIGFGSYRGGPSGMTGKGNDDRLEAVGLYSDDRATRRPHATRSRSPRRESKRERSRDRSRDRDRERRRHRHGHDHHHHHRHERRHRSRSRSRSHDRDRRRDPERSHHRRRTPSRSRSPDRRRHDRDERDRRRERDYSADGRRDHRYRGRDRDSEYDRRR